MNCDDKKKLLRLSSFLTGPAGIGMNRKQPFNDYPIEEGQFFSDGKLWIHYHKIETF